MPILEAVGNIASLDTATEILSTADATNPPRALPIWIPRRAPPSSFVKSLWALHPLRPTAARELHVVAHYPTFYMSASKLLSDADFSHIVRHAPLVSIDILVKDPELKVLLGLRVNEPAKGQYFVPGGVIRKNEKISDAFVRILKAETGLERSFDAATFLGVFEHFYPNNRFEIPNCETHYVVLGYELRFDRRPSIELDSQHSEIRWMSSAEIASATDVHPNSKAYFNRKE